MSATRSTIASTQTASPAVTRAITVRSPCSSVRDRPTYRRRRSASSFAAWPSTSASMIAASAIASTRPAESRPITAATATSTSPTTA